MMLGWDGVGQGWPEAVGWLVPSYCTAELEVYRKRGQADNNVLPTVLYSDLL